MTNLKLLISASSLIACWALVAVAYSPLTLASQMSTLVSNSSEHNQDYMAFEGNATLQKLVRAKYGVNIQKLLNIFSYKNDSVTYMPAPYYNSTVPEWQPKLLMHLVKDKIQKSNQTLKLTPETFVDDGKLYFEFSIKIETMTLNDQVYCYINPPLEYIALYIERERTDNFTFWARKPLFLAYNGTTLYCTGVFHINGTTHEVYSEPITIVFQRAAPELVNQLGPWVWPSAPVIEYDKPTPVKLDCWTWLWPNDTVTLYLIQGNNKEQIATLKQNYGHANIRLEFSKIIDSSHNGSVILCEAESNPSNKKAFLPPQNITLLYYGPIDAISDECKNLAMLGWGMVAVLALSVVLVLDIVIGKIEPVKKTCQTTA